MQGITPSDNELYNGVPLEPTPSNRQGWGRVDLSRSLPLQATTDRLQARLCTLPYFKC